MRFIKKKIRKIRNWWYYHKKLPDLRARLEPLKKDKTHAYKVALFSHEMSSTGAPIMLLVVAKAILKDGGQVRVLSYLDGSLRPTFEALGIEVFVHPGFRTNKSLINEFAGDCDYAIANTVVTYPVISLLKGPEILWWVHESQVIDKDYIARYKRKKFRPDLEASLGMAKKVAVVTEYSKQVVQKYSSHVKILNLAIEDLFPEGIPHRKPHDKILFSILGAVCPIKGQDVALKAFTTLPEKYQEQMTLYIAGRDVDEFSEDLKQRYSHHPHVEWGTSVPYDKLKEFYSNSDVILVASRDESFSLVALEACMAGKPLIISTNVGAKFLVTPGENGFIFESENIESLQKAIIQMLENKHRLQEMGDNSRQKYIDNGTLEVFSHKFLQLMKGEDF